MNEQELTQLKHRCWTQGVIIGALLATAMIVGVVAVALYLA